MINSISAQLAGRFKGSPGLLGIREFAGILFTIEPQLQRVSIDARVYALVALFLMAILSKTQAQGRVDQAQERVDIVQIYENFIASRVAAMGCNAIDKATEFKFVSNLQIVTIRAAMALKERYPNLSDAALTSKVRALPYILAETVKAEIAQNGCSSDRIKHLLELYKLHSVMSLGG